MTKSSTKINIASYNVLKTLDVLLQGNFTMQEICSKLDKCGYHFSNNVISKYINTCRHCGIDIKKVGNAYIVTNMIFGINLTSNEVALIEKLQDIAKVEMNAKVNGIFDRFIDKINIFSNKQISKIDKRSFQIFAEYFEMAITEQRKIRFTLKDNTVMDCIPINVVQNKSKTFFHVIHDDDDKVIDINKILSAQLTNVRYIKQFQEQVVIYKLKGSLAQRYTLRNNENLIKPYDGYSITVSNRAEAKDILISRLLRYDDKCEIISPKIYRDKMKEVIGQMLGNYCTNEQ